MPLTACPPSQRLIDLVGELGGSWHGRTAICRCPVHPDQTPSLSLRQGDRDILVTCFAGCDRDDILRALRRIHPGRHHPRPDDAPPTHRANIARLWENAFPAGTGLGARYLARRHFADVPLDLRFLPRCPHGPSPRTVLKPALLVGVREERALVAIQRIFLDPETADYTEKVMLGRPGRGAWRGRAPGPVLAIAEGFETAEAFSMLNGVPCWAALGARRLDQLTIPDTVTTLLIAEDNDAEGRRAAARAMQRHLSSGMIVRRTPPPPNFKDWAEVLDDRAARTG